MYHHIGSHIRDDTIVKLHANIYFGPDYNRTKQEFNSASTELKERVFRLYEPLLESIEIPWEEVNSTSIGFEFLHRKKKDIKLEPGALFRQGGGNTDYWKDQAN